MLVLIGTTEIGGVSVELKSEMKTPGEGVAVDVAVGKDALVAERDACRVRNVERDAGINFQKGIVGAVGRYHHRRSGQASEARR